MYICKVYSPEADEIASLVHHVVNGVMLHQNDNLLNFVIFKKTKI
jgi:hypothetical protein